MDAIGKLILRLGLGGLMLPHGIGKFKPLFAGGEVQFPDPLGIGPTFSVILTIFSEAICAFLVIIGLKTRWAAIPLVITMLVAALIFHAPDPFMKMEFPLVYAIGFLSLVFLGSGKYSVDELIHSK